MAILELPSRERLDYKKEVQDRKLYWFWKRTQDIVLSCLALALLWPAFALIAAVIYIDDPHGSPFYVQTRVGRKGKEFRFIKFRSMYVDADARLEELMSQNEMDGPVFKIRNDPRVTRVGRFIRRSSIDELPQLINILKGEMTLVGPRPALPREVAQYDAYQEQRLMVTPGLTCYWQIQPCRNDLSFEEWVNLDLRYIKERSFLTDWKIILKTFGTVLGMGGV